MATWAKALVCATEWAKNVRWPALVLAPGRKGLMVCFLQLLLFEQNRVEIVKSVRENRRIPRSFLIAGIVLGPAESVFNRHHLALALKWFPGRGSLPCSAPILK
jgi:hypothetical protein